ncbi:MAG: hypothetical protein R2747_12430 [Pyrinomonadaceae bacterium]
MFKLVIALFALSGMIVFAATNETVSRALNITRPDVKVQISGVVQRNDQTLSVEKVEAVNSGEILDWKISSVNEGNASAENYRVVGQIPEGTSFVAGTARSEQKGSVTYSIDGGKEFSAQPLIDEKQADGSVKKVPAPVSMYTHLKFEWSAPLGVKEKLDASYRVRVK